MKHLLIVPPPRPGGGPSNAVLRILRQFDNRNIQSTTNMFSLWHVALLNVGVGIRLDILQYLRFGRRLVYRIDGCYSKEIFERQQRPWRHEYEQINQRISKALRLADFVIYQSNYAKQFLDQMQSNLSKEFAIIPNGVDLIKFSPLEKINSQLPTIGCIGTFRSNRIKMILDIARRLNFKHRLLLVGRMDDECKQDLKEFLALSHNLCKVDYVPHVTSDEKLVNYYRQIDCFIHPIIGDWCPNAVVEALACGVPTIVPVWSGSSELVGDGGIIVNHPSWEDYSAFIDNFAYAVEQVFEHQKEYSLRARMRAVEYLDIIKVANAYQQAFNI